MSDPPERILDSVAAAIDDDTPVDWRGEEAAAPQLRRELECLRQIEKVVQAYRRLGGRDPAEGRLVLFRWGKLEVLEKLGEGGYGEVYRAVDPLLDRDVALKLRRPRAGQSDDAALQRQLEEGQRLARVRHPNVLVVHGAGVHDGRVGIWTDLVAGETLEERLARDGPLAAHEAIPIGLDLCRAVAAVHAAGLVHGDVKTSNVMRERGGRIVLMDFGTAAERRADGTFQALAVGTPVTMAPEVLRGESPQSSADLYALGVLLFRLVTGRYPVEASSLEELQARHARGERLALSELRPDLPLAFAAVVERALAALPAQRYPSAAAMGPALAALLDTPTGVELREEAGSRPPGVWRRARKPLAVAVAVLLALLAVAYLRWGQQRPRATTAIRNLAVLPLRTIGGAAGEESLGLAVTDGLIARLSGYDELRVRSTAAVLPYSDPKVDPSTAGERLDADAIVHGTVQQVSDRLRIELQLIEVRGRPLWAGAFDRDRAELLALEDAAVGELLHALGVRAPARPSSPAAPVSTNLDAYRAYLRGLELMADPNAEEESMNISAEMFRRAAEIDPRFAAAFANRATVLLWLDFVSRDQAMLATARDALARARQLAPTDPAVRLATGYYDYWALGDYERALADFRALAKASPSSGEAQAGIAAVLRRQGKYDQALAHFQQAVALRSRWPGDAAYEVAFTLKASRRFAEAEAAYRRRLASAPDFRAGWGELARLSLAWKGPAAARAALNDAPPGIQVEPRWLPLYLALCDHDFAAAVRRIPQEPEPNSAWLGAYAYLRLGDRRAAARLVDSGIAEAERRLRQEPDSVPRHAVLARLYALANRREDALREGRRGVALLANDAFWGPREVENLALVHAILGDRDEALDRLERLSRMSYVAPITARRLLAEPWWDSLRSDPRMARLTADPG